MKSAYLKSLLLMVCFFITISGWAQVKKITGKITDENNNPLIGVTVSVNKKTVTETDANGEFSLEAAAGNTLSFSSAGFASQEIKVGNSSTVTLSMKAAVAKLEEVVVVGYGKQSRRTLSGAVASLDANALKSSPSSNVGTALQGTIPGLRVQQSTGQPGTTPNIIFRGGTNYDGTGSPLIVLDGTIVPSLYGINMDDVESIDVLKDAGSTAIYGARASNGVVLITTKKGKKGRTQVNYSMRQTTNYVRRNPLQYMNAAQYIHWNRLGIGSAYQGYLADGNTSTANSRANVLNSASTGWAYPSSNSSSIALYSTQLVSNSNRQLLGNPLWHLLVDPNPFVTGQNDSILYRETSQKTLEDAIMQQATTLENYVNVSGASDQGSFALGLGVINDHGIVPGAGLKRLSMNFNGGLNVGKNLKISMNTSAYFVNQTVPYNDPNANSGTPGTVVGSGSGITGGFFQRIVGIGPTVRWTNDTSGAVLPGNSDPTLANPKYMRPLFNINNTNQQRLTGSVNIEYTLLPSLKFLASGSGYLLYNNANIFNKAYQLGSGGSFNTNRSAAFSNYNDVQYSYNAFLQYDKTFGDHKLTVLGGAEFYDYTEHSFSGTAQGAPSDFIPWLSASTNPSVINNAIINAQSAYSDFNRWDRLASVIGRVNYSYLDRYFLTANLRYDGTSRLATNRYGYFPGISAGWNMQNEKFFQNSSVSKFVNVFKPRISWGQNGSITAFDQYSDLFRYFPTAYVYNSLGNYNGASASYASSLVNPDLKWEKSSTLNFGLDIGLFSNRISIIGDYYIRNIYDKITTIPISSQTGFTSYITNLGQLQNRGFELDLKASIIRPGTVNGLSIDFSANVATVKSFAIKLPFNGLPGNRQGTIQVWDPKNPGQLMQVGGLQEGHRIGLDEVWAPSYSGLYLTQGQIDKDAKVYNSFLPYNNKTIKLLGDARWDQVYANDTIDQRQFVYVGRTTPNIVGGFSTAVSYKGFSLYAQFDYALNFVILNNEKLRGLSQAQGSQNSSVDVLNTWSASNSTGTLPRFYYANDGRNYGTSAAGANPAKQFWEKGDYLMVRELTLSYEVTHQILKNTLKNKIKGFRVYLTGSNLAYLTQYDGTFPEFGGVDSGKYPLPKRLTVGVNLTL
jgi:TonB-linked SusC/RagA family outer membrane protein